MASKCDLARTLGGNLWGRRDADCSPFSEGGFAGARADCFALRRRGEVVFILRIWEDFYTALGVGGGDTSLHSAVGKLVLSSFFLASSNKIESLILPWNI